MRGRTQKVCLAVVFGALVLAASALAATKPIHGKIIGTFGSKSSCFGCGDMVKYVRADRVWCAWQGDNVIIHVRFRNSSIEHLTINWHPTYIVKGGGPHGEGFSSMQDSGINAKASRGVYVKQKPKGVPVGSPLSKCKPSYSLVESG
jgi:hypothetical protein